MLNKNAIKSKRNSAGGQESGVTLLEMVVAILILTVGLLGMAGAISYALSVSNRGRNITNTKLLVVSMLEQMETLRNSKELTFGQIANAGSVDNTGGNRTFTGFPTTFLPVSANPGPDGIYGTNDDLIDPGPDNVYGTADDFTNNNLAVPNYTRQVLITFLNGNQNLKKVQVTLKYPGSNGVFQTMVGVSYVNNDAHSNYL